MVFSRAPRYANLFSACFNWVRSGGVGNGKFTTFSIPRDFIWRTNSSTGLFWISGTDHPSNSSLKTADEYSLYWKGIWVN